MPERSSLEELVRSRMLDKVHIGVQRKLLNMLGPDEAEELVRELLPLLGLRALTTPDDCFRFGTKVIERGGIYGILGKSIQTQAILNGAGR
jgi:hypothetical protein